MTTQKDIQNLIDAIIADDADKVRDLLQRGVNPNLCQDQDMISPLHFAAQHNSLKSVPYLLAANADPYAMTSEYVSPHDIARLHGHMEMVKLLQSSRWVGSTAKN